MTLSKKNFCDAIKTLEALWIKTDKVLDYLTESFINQYLDAYYDLLIKACNFKDEEYLMDVISWFCVDTNFGQNERNRIINDKYIIWDIATPERLYDYLVTKE